MLFGALEQLSDKIATGNLMDFLIPLAITGVIFTTSLYAAFRYMIKARTLEDVPTSKARSAEQGYVELEGVAQMLPGDPVRAPYSGRECVWWSSILEKRDGDGDWRKVRTAASDSIFQLKDATGTCLVDPEGADVYPEHSLQKRGNPGDGEKHVLVRKVNYRWREYYIFEHEQICVIGLFRTHKSTDNWDHEHELRTLLGEWKRDQPALLSRFDTDRDGVIDQDEWKVARKEAAHELARELKEVATHPGVSVIGCPPDRRPFLMAPLSNSDFARTLRKKAIWAALGSAASGLGCLFVLSSRFFS